MTVARALRPILLTKIDALTYAADVLERHAADMELGEVIMGLVGDMPSEMPAEHKAQFDKLRQLSVEPKLQAAAMRAGAKTIRDLVLEERLVAARVEAGAGIGKP